MLGYGIRPADTQIGQELWTTCEGERKEGCGQKELKSITQAGRAEEEHHAVSKKEGAAGRSSERASLLQEEFRSIT
eukprot:scaffold321223_cov14-Tisochrysis_lutea.AAC.1